MERFMLLCDSCQNRNQNGNGHVSSDKKWIPNSFIKKGNFYFFLSCHCAKNNRRGNIGFCKEADNGASCLHCPWWEGSYQFAGRVMMAPFSRSGAPWEGSSFLSSFHFFLSPSLFPSFHPSFLLEPGCFWLWPNSQVGLETMPFSAPRWIHPAKQGASSYSGPADYKQVQTHLGCSQLATSGQSQNVASEHELLFCTCRCRGKVIIVLQRVLLNISITFQSVHLGICSFLL